MSRAALVLIASLLLWSCSGSSSAPEPAAPAEPAPPAELSADDQIAQMAQACAEAAPTIARRQAESSLYERLGGRDGIESILVELVDVHMANPTIRPFFEGVDVDTFVQNATDFMSAGIGGDSEYIGGDLREIHAPMNISSEVFLVAGADIQQAMQNKGVGPDEQQEMMCAFLGLREMVMAAPAEADEGV